jgi:lipoate-protein ligase B
LTYGKILHIYLAAGFTGGFRFCLAVAGTAMFNMSDSTINIINCGLKDYQSILTLQENTLQDLLSGTGKDTIFIVEHQPVITLGARDSANKLTKDINTIKQAGIEIFQTRRGGGTTAHNPGQLVVYPIIKIGRAHV